MYRTVMAYQLQTLNYINVSFNCISTIHIVVSYITLTINIIILMVFSFDVISCANMSDFYAGLIDKIY